MKNFFNEFKAFTLKGNVLNLAVGIMIGAAFQNIVTSLTDNILSPIIGLFAGQNFDALLVNIFGVEIRYGAFITSVINFFIMAFVIFIIFKGLNKIMPAQPEKEEPAARTCPFCFTEIHNEATKCPACTSEII